MDEGLQRAPRKKFGEEESSLKHSINVNKCKINVCLNVDELRECHKLCAEENVILL